MSVFQGGPVPDLTKPAVELSHYLGDIYDLLVPYIKNDSTFMPPLQRFLVAQLVIELHLTSESCLLLVLNRKFWDAEMLLRSILEGTLKLTYMLHGEEEEVHQKCVEFWYVLPNLDFAKKSGRLNDLVGSFPLDPLTKKIFDPLCLTPEDEALYRQGLNKNQRKQLENKWSFGAILEFFEKHDDCKIFKHFKHQYGHSSNVMHFDGCGIGLRWERSQRSPEERECIELAQCARILLDLSSFSELRCHDVLVSCGVELDSLLALKQKYAKCHLEISKINKSFDPDNY